MVFDKVVKYNSCLLHSWIKSLKSGTLRYCIFIARFLETSTELQVQHLCQGCVKLLTGFPVHFCTPAAAPCTLQTSSIKGFSLLLLSSSCLKAEQEWEADWVPGHISSLVWRLMSDPAGPACPGVCVHPNVSQSNWKHLAKTGLTSGRDWDILKWGI